MSYNTIMNNPWERHTCVYPWVYWDNAFNEEELQKMCDYFAEKGVERGTTVGAAKTSANTGEVIIDQAPNEKVRKSNVKFHNRNENTAWIYDRFNWVIQQLNEQFFGFDLYGYDTWEKTFKSPNWREEEEYLERMDEEYEALMASDDDDDYNEEEDYTNENDKYWERY